MPNQKSAALSGKYIFTQIFQVKMFHPNQQMLDWFLCTILRVTGLLPLRVFEKIYQDQTYSIVSESMIFTSLSFCSEFQKYALWARFPKRFAVAGWVFGRNDKGSSPVVVTKRCTINWTYQNHHEMHFVFGIANRYINNRSNAVSHVT